MLGKVGRRLLVVGGHLPQKDLLRVELGLLADPAGQLAHVPGLEIITVFILFSY